ncbi:MAG: dihydroorotate dehydrogenase-like protein [Pirellulales bacterium]|nr:dihydroorotate dehydrogenase-like protein [Pirellulales bacterium]
MKPSLKTRYLGMKLKNPLVASAGPLTGDLDTLRRLEDAGASAAVLPSLFEEQVEYEELEIHNFYEFQAYSHAESLTHFPEMHDYNTGPEEYLYVLQRAKESLSIPVIGSLNGWSEGGWVRYAKAIEQAGANALELNIYFVPSDPTVTAAEIEQRYVDLVTAVRETISIPLAVKIGQNFSSLPHFARQLCSAGADGLVLFNRYLEADINLETLEYHPDLVLSNRHEARIPIRWISLLRDEIDCSLAATSGVHRAQGIIKLLLAGADVTMMASILLMKGPEYLRVLLEEVQQWLTVEEYTSVEQLKGSMSRGNCSNPSALERANYMKALVSYTPPEQRWSNHK